MVLSFFDFPRELRDQVYHYHFENLLTQSHRNSKRYTAIFRANKQLYSETRDVFFKSHYTKLHFQFRNFGNLASYIKKFGTVNPKFTGQIRIPFRADFHDEDPRECRDYVHIETMLRRLSCLEGWRSESDDGEEVDEEAEEEDDEDSDEFEYMLRDLVGNRVRDMLSVHGLQGEGYILTGLGEYVEVRYLRQVDGMVFLQCLQIEGEIGAFPWSCKTENSGEGWLCRMVGCKRVHN